MTIETMTDYFPVYLEKNKPKWKAATHDEYQWFIEKHMNGDWFFSDVPIDTLKHKDLRDYALKSLGYKTKAHISKEFRVINGILRIALVQSGIGPGAVPGIDSLVCHKRKVHDVIFTRDETSAIIKCCETYNTYMYIIPLLIFSTGLKIGQVLGLDVLDVDLLKNVIKVKKTFRKGKLSRRDEFWVPMSQCLSEHMEHYVSKIREDNGVHLFGGKYGDRLCQNSYNNTWWALLGDLNIYHLSSEAIRGTYFERCQQRPMRLQDII